MVKSRTLLVIAGVSLLGAGALIAARRSRAPARPVLASASAAASVLAPAASSSPAAPRVSVPMEFSFDCTGLPAAAATCAGASPLAEKLVQSSLWTRTNGIPCAGSLKGARADAAARALREAEPLAHAQLSPLERALLQNAALRLLSCSVNVEAAAQRLEIARNAKRLVKALALSAAEIAALPSSANSLAFLGDGNDWQVGTLRTHLHEISDGYVSTVERVRHEQELASVYRLILVDDKGELHATDVVSKLLLRRPAQTPGRFSACIATLDPASAHCGVASLSPASPALQSEALELTGASPACHQCHVQNHANSLHFGPNTGLGPDTVSLDQARGPLLAALQR